MFFLAFLSSVLSLVLADVSIDRVLDDLSATGYVDRQDLEKTAIEAIIRWLELQEGSEILQIYQADQFKMISSARQGNRFGVGISVLDYPGYGMMVQEVYSGSSADKAGIVRGDVITAMNSSDIILSSDVIQPLMLDIVTISGVPKRVRLTPSTFKAKPLSIFKGDGYSQALVHYLGEGIVEELSSFLELEGDLVLDLRDVSDGDLSVTLDALALIVGGKQKVGNITDGSGTKELVTPSNNAPYLKPLALLVDRETAGLAELFALALGQMDNVQIFGLSTAGVAVLPVFVEAGEIVLSVAGPRLTSADNTTWAHVGIIPDVEVLRVPGRSLMPPPAPVPDLQLDMALTALRSPKDPAK